MAKFWDPSTWFRRSETVESKEHKDKPGEDIKNIPPGRISVPDDNSGFNISVIKALTSMVTPSFRTELIPLIRALYKVNPDMSIAIQDMFKLANTGHSINFPNNSPEEAAKMRAHLENASKGWSRYTAGMDGLVNKFIVQSLVGGAMSFEAVPNKDLTGLSTIVFINPENVIFKREQDGVYHPYQINKFRVTNEKPQYIKLNNETYKYVASYNDTDEPYGVPPFMAGLDSIKTQADLRTNFKNIMEIMGMVGFLEASMEKPARRANESEHAYIGRLNKTLRDLKKNIREGMKDGVVVGFKDDHEFKLNSTSATLQNIDIPWNQNQQSVANGLGIHGNLIGLSNSSTEGGAGIMLSKLISQLKNIQMMLKYALEFIYALELRLAGFNNKGVDVSFGTSTISDELKVQQGLEYKLRNLVILYNQGIISQEQFAWAMGYTKPDQKEPRVQPEDDSGVSSGEDHAKKQKREADKDKSDRSVRDKNKIVPKRKDQKPT